MRFLTSLLPPSGRRLSQKVQDCQQLAHAWNVMCVPCCGLQDTFQLPVQLADEGYRESELLNALLPVCRSPMCVDHPLPDYHYPSTTTMPPKDRLVLTKQ